MNDLNSYEEGLAIDLKAALDRIEELEAILWAADYDAQEAEAYAVELEANLAEQIEWVKSLADDLIAAEGREARLKEKLAKAVEALEYYAVEALPWEVDDSLQARTTIAELTGGKDE